MISSSDSQTLTLRHEPYGEQHPYLPLPFERSPRDPIANEPVILGVETGHTPSADTIWCVWRVDDNPAENRTEAEMRAIGETGDQWKIKLPAFNDNETVRYRLFAKGQGQQVESEEFTFSVLSWVEVISVLEIEKTTEQLVVKLATTQADLCVQLRAEAGIPGILSLRFTAFHDTRVFRNTPSKTEPVIAEWGELCLTLNRNPLRLELSRKSDGLTLQSEDPIRVLVNADGTVLQYKLGFMSPADEAFYGFGERFNALDQRGNQLDNYVYGQYTGQGKRAYIPIPFFISSRGYGLWLQTDRQAKFDLAAAESDRWAVTGYAEDEYASLEVKLFFQQHPREIVQAFTGWTGKPKLPPSWVFGPWMSSNDWNSQAEVIRQLHETQKQNIPATVLVIEAWSDEINFYIWNDTQYPPKSSANAYSLGDYIFPPEGRWPDLKAMVNELHEAGLRLVLWQNPLIKQGEPREHLDERVNNADQEYAIKKGFVVTRGDGSPHRVESHMPWFRNSLVFDFSNPEAAEWWFKNREYLVAELGVDGFKTDGGEHIWDPGTRFFNGLRGSRGINNYPLVYEAAYRKFMEAYRGDDYVLFSRAGYTGAQQNPCHWAGDENSTWDAFRATLRALLNVGLCGLPFVGWDIAGFAGPIPTSELYLRATAFSVFCPIMQYHSDVNAHRIPSRDRTPWNIQEQTGDVSVIPIFRKFANLRMNLLPYILSTAQECGQTGLPIMRALPLEYPGDLVCRKYPYEYLFGEALLVAPVIEEGVTTWPVYLPEGDWRELWTGEVYHGPTVVDMNIPYDRIPVFQKKGSTLPLHLDESGELGSPVGNNTEEFDYLTLYIYPGEKINSSFLQGSRSAPVHIAVETRENEKRVEINLPALSLGVDLIVFGSEPTSVIVDDTLLPCLDAGMMRGSTSGWQWNVLKQEIRLHFPEPSQPVKIIIQ